MGMAILIEVTGFALHGGLHRPAWAPRAVAGHQIAANLVSMLFMLPLALGNALPARWWRSAWGRSDSA
jgi:MATE family multidrug resistance protein